MVKKLRRPPPSLLEGYVICVPSLLQYGVTRLRTTIYCSMPINTTTGMYIHYQAICTKRKDSTVTGSRSEKTKLEMGILEPSRDHISLLHKPTVRFFANSHSTHWVGSFSFKVTNFRSWKRVLFCTMFSFSKNPAALDPQYSIIEAKWHPSKLFTALKLRTSFSTFNELRIIVQTWGGGQMPPPPQAGDQHPRRFRKTLNHL